MKLALRLAAAALFAATLVIAIDNPAKPTSPDPQTGDSIPFPCPPCTPSLR